MKNEWKIRRWLGDRYHLNIELSFSEDKTKTESWKLFKKYQGYLEDNSGPIMTSETHSEKDLYKFAKQHRIYELSLVSSITMMIISLLNLILVFTNSFIFKNTFIRAFIWGINFVIIIVSIINFIYQNHNLMIKNKEFKENFIKRFEKILEKENKKDE